MFGATTTVAGNLFCLPPLAKFLKEAPAWHPCSSRWLNQPVRRRWVGKLHSCVHNYSRWEIFSNADGALGCWEFQYAGPPLCWVPNHMAPQQQTSPSSRVCLSRAAGSQFGSGRPRAYLWAGWFYRWRFPHLWAAVWSPPRPGTSPSTPLQRTSPLVSSPDERTALFLA